MSSKKRNKIFDPNTTTSDTTDTTDTTVEETTDTTDDQPDTDPTVTEPTPPVVEVEVIPPTEEPINLPTMEPIEPTQQTVTAGNFYLDDPINDRRLTEALNILIQPTDGVYEAAPYAGAQVVFYMCLHRIVANPPSPDSLKYFLDHLLDFAWANKDTHFNPKKVYTACANLSISELQQLEFQMLIKLIMDTANPAVRYKVAKGFNWAKVADSFQNHQQEQLLENLRTYYNVE